MKSPYAWLALVAALFVSACSTSSSPAAGLSDADRAAIAQVRDSVNAALNRADLDALYSHLTSDHVTAPPNHVPMTVGDSLRAWHTSFFNQGTVRVTPGPSHLVGAGDVAVDTYSFTLSLQPKAGGSPLTDRGKAIWIWRRQADGAWKLSNAIWNSDLPLPPPK